jgi:hypothetical protein
MDDVDHSPGDKPQMVSRPSIKQPRRRKLGGGQSQDDYRERILNGDEFPDGTLLTIAKVESYVYPRGLTGDDFTRWQNRRQLRQELEEILKDVSHSDELKLLDVVGFAAALETREWMNEGEHDLSYKERIDDVQQNFVDWHRVWEEDDGVATGRALFEQYMDETVGDKFVLGTAPSDHGGEIIQNPVPTEDENALAELAGWGDTDSGENEGSPGDLSDADTDEEDEEDEYDDGDVSLRDPATWTEEGFEGLFPKDFNRGIRTELQTDIRSLLNRFPEDDNIFDFTIYHAICGMMYRAFSEKYKPRNSMLEYIGSLHGFSLLVQACGESWATALSDYEGQPTGRDHLNHVLRTALVTHNEQQEALNAIRSECYETIKLELKDLVSRLPESSGLKRMKVDQVAHRWEECLWDDNGDGYDYSPYIKARDEDFARILEWKEFWNSMSDGGEEMNGQALFVNFYCGRFGSTFLEPEGQTDDKRDTEADHDDVSSHGETDFYDNEDANEDVNAGNDLISPKSPPNSSPPSSPQQTSDNVPDTSNTPSLSLEPPAEHMATDQTYDAQVRDTSFNFKKMGNVPQESSFQLPGISFGGASASSTLMAPAYSPQDMVASQDPLSVQYDVHMDCEDEQFGAATTLQPVSASALPDPDESIGDVEMSYDIPDDQAARPIEVVKSTAIVPIFSPPAALSAPIQTDFFGSISAANPVNTKPIFNWTPSVFAPKASTPAPFVFQGQTVVDFGVDTSSLSGLTQRPIAPQQPLQQLQVIFPPTEEQQAELSAGATHPQAQQVGSTVQSDSAEEEIATSSAVASQPEADEASIELEGEVLPVVPQDGLGEVEETVQDFFEDAQNEISETHSQGPSSPEDNQANPSFPDSDTSGGTVVGTVVDCSPAQAPQTPGASSQAQMIMDKHAEMHRDLCAKMEAITATLSSLQQSGIVDQGNAVASEVSALDQEVAAFGQISEKEVMEQLAKTSGMAIVPEEQEQSEVLVEASGMATVPEEQPEVLDEVLPELDIAGDAETSDLPADFPPEAIVEKPENEDADGTAPETSLQPLEESNAADSNLEDDLAEHTGRIAQWEARQKRKRSMFAAEDAALLHHRNNPMQRPSRLVKTAKLATRIARFINEWQAEIAHDLPSLFIDGVEDLIDRYHERYNADSTRALNNIRELHNQWVCMRNTIRAWKSLLKHFSAEKLEGLRHEYNAYDLATLGSPEKEKLYWRLEKKIRSLHECFHRASDHTKSHQTVFLKAWESEIGGSITNYFDYLAGVLGYYIGGLGMASS